MFQGLAKNSSVFQKDHSWLLFRIDSTQNLGKFFMTRSLCFDYWIRFGFCEAFVHEIDEPQIAVPFELWFFFFAKVNFVTQVVSVYWYRIIALFQPSVVLVVPARTSSPASGPMASPRRSSIGVPSHRDSKFYPGPIIYLLQTLAYTLRPF